MSEGTQPDPRDALANERTYLAWVRTSLALVAAGIGVVRLLPTFDVPGAKQTLGLALVLTGALVALTSPRRWRRVDAAMRAGDPVPPPVVGAVVSVVVAVVGSIIAAFLVWGTKS